MHDSWATEQLSEFMWVFDPERPDLLASAVGRIAEAFDAEVAAVTSDGEIQQAWGITENSPLRSTVPAATDRRWRAALEPLGDLDVLTVPIEMGTRGEGHLHVGRVAEPLDDLEESLLRAIARAYAIALRSADALEVAVAARELAEQRLTEKRALLEDLSQRQTTLERLFGIQRAISHRAPTSEVLDAICLSASELIAGVYVAIWVIDPADGQLALVSCVGTSGEIERVEVSLPTTEGIAGTVISDDRFVPAALDVSDHRVPGWDELRIDRIMCAPVHRDGVAEAAIMVGAVGRDGAEFDAAEQEVLLAFAETASVALNDASAVEAIESSLRSARFDATHDALTGVANRAAAVRHLQSWLSEGRDVAVVFIDLDRFKSINDLYGHASGDAVLCAVAESLRDAVRSDDFVARLAGDEFVALIADVDQAGAEEFAHRLRDATQFSFRHEGRIIPVSASIGVASSLAQASNSGNQDRADALVRDADAAMYLAKQTGRGRVQQFDCGMRERLTHRNEIERELTEAIDNSEFEPWFQPTVRLSDGHVVGYEALARWNHPQRGVSVPALFIDIAEEIGVIEDIDLMVLHKACTQLSAWRASGLVDDTVRVGVNLSARHFVEDRIVAAVADVLTSTGLPARCLWLELTETAMMEELTTALQVMNGIQALGVQLVVDDFGTGWSSLAYLKQFPVEALKIDRAFVSGLTERNDDQAIVSATIRLAGALGLSVVAEGVEDEQQAEALRLLGCRLAQGYLYGRPAPGPDIFAAAPSASSDRSGGVGTDQ